MSPRPHSPEPSNAEGVYDFEDPVRIVVSVEDQAKRDCCGCLAEDDLSRKWLFWRVRTGADQGAASPSRSNPLINLRAARNPCVSCQALSATLASVGCQSWTSPSSSRALATGPSPA